jgi:RimJ/RimL family protein N-acetyltransferase
MAREPAVRLREVVPADLPIHFEQQRDPESNRMAGVPARDRAAFDAHWARILADPAVLVRTIVAGEEVAGSALSFVRDGRREVGYWIARERWGQGIATAALAALLAELRERPLFARVATGNGASVRVLERCGFRVVEEHRDADPPFDLLRLD